MPPTLPPLAQTAPYTPSPPPPSQEQQHLEMLQQPDGPCSSSSFFTATPGLPNTPPSMQQQQQQQRSSWHQPRFLRSALLGVAGSFTGGQLAVLRGCLPEGAVQLIEADQRVHKAEGRSYGTWWEAPPPSTVVQSQERSTTPPPDARRSTSNTNTTDPAAVPPTPTITPSGGGTDASASTVSYSPLERWMLARVGLRAQAALTQLLQRQQQLKPEESAGADASSASLSSSAADQQPPAVRRFDGDASASLTGVDRGPTAAPEISSTANDQAAAAVAAVFDGVTTNDSLNSSGEPDRATAMQGGRGVAARALWNLDRIDQRGLPLNGRYWPPGSGEGVTIYTLDRCVCGGGEGEVEVVGGVGWLSLSSCCPV